MLPKFANAFKVEEEENGKGSRSNNTRRSTFGGSCSSKKGSSTSVVVGLKILVVQISQGKSNIVIKPTLIKHSSSKPSSSASQTHQYSCFLKSCFLCNKNLSLDKDVYMYRGDQGYCSIECRNRQIILDDMRELESSTKKMVASYRSSNISCSKSDRRETQSKIQDSVSKIKCTDMNCEAVLEPHLCHEIIPKQVFARWENALSKALIFGSKIFYCPYKDCAAVMVDDNGEIVTESECPNCHRLFCCQCNVSWHVGLDCKEFQRLGGGERQREDLMMMELAKKKQWRRCPNCKFYVEKRDGCVHISCRCEFEFYYGCGSAWSSVHQCPRI
ncbi:hypothetical protein Dsin_014571 [Dipteronia sinensis]|uniref:Uncharacterized protein n=1 Tax=Dipteronia sinensis TaxID=43782 RepID=A0AAE0AM09_9ROSI|nr:hypothetical protein Dsin_014571 [Dipteronia sinensis]